MAVLELVTIPDRRLRVDTKRIEKFDESLQKIIDDMIETMYEARGVGLAATQVGLDMSLSVIDCTPEQKTPLVFINPEILETHEFTTMEEGCLSVPGHYDTVTRATKVKVKALDRHGKEFTLEAEGLLAECLQHEVDHLHGKLYIDQLSKFKQNRIQEKVTKYLRKKLKDEK